MQWIGEDALWEKLAPAAIDVEVGGLSVMVVSYDGLVALKEQAGRPEDLLDLQRLREARGEAWEDERISTAAGVVAAAAARVAGARALHHAAALLAGRAEVEA
jgi:hypothetical protein